MVYRTQKSERKSYEFLLFLGRLLWTARISVCVSVPARVESPRASSSCSSRCREEDVVGASKRADVICQLSAQALQVNFGWTTGGEGRGIRKGNLNMPRLTFCHLHLMINWILQIKWLWINFSISHNTGSDTGERGWRSLGHGTTTGLTISNLCGFRWPNELASGDWTHLNDEMMLVWC